MPISHAPSILVQSRIPNPPSNSETLRTRIDELFAGNSVRVPSGAGSSTTSGPAPRTAPVFETLDRLAAETALQEAIAAVNEQFKSLRGDFLASWVVADDSKASCPNRPLFEFSRVFEKPSELSRGWVVPVWWSSSPASAQELSYSAREQLYLLAHVAAKGPVMNLMSWLMLQGRAIGFSGRPIDESSVEAAKRISTTMRRHYNVQSLPELIACIYGDPVAKTLGHPELGYPSGSGRLASLVFA